jgi:hypothetical protein
MGKQMMKTVCYWDTDIDREDKGDKIQETSVDPSQLTRWNIRKDLNAETLKILVFKNFCLCTL